MRQRSLLPDMACFRTDLIVLRIARGQLSPIHPVADHASQPVYANCVKLLHQHEEVGREGADAAGLVVAPPRWVDPIAVA